MTTYLPRQTRYVRESRGSLTACLHWQDRHVRESRGFGTPAVDGGVVAAVMMLMLGFDDDIIVDEVSYLLYLGHQDSQEITGWRVIKITRTVCVCVVVAGGACQQT